MFTALTDANKYTEEGLLIRYDQQVIEMSSGGGTFPIYRISRYATKRYKYVSLTADAAKTGAKNKVDKYTRGVRFYLPGEVVSYKDSIQCQAQIRAVHKAGPVWEVSIDVNETDVAYSLQAVADPSAFFTWISDDYDEDED